MNKKLNLLLSILAITCWLNLAFSRQNSSRTAGDTTIHFVPEISEYNLVLEGRKQLLDYDTIRPHQNYNTTLLIKNNSEETIVILYVRTNSSGKMLADLTEPERSEEIKPGKSICVTVKPNVYRPGPFSAWATIAYKTAGAEKELIVHVRGYILPADRITDAPVTTEERKPSNPPVKASKPVKVPEPVLVQPKYTLIPEGPTRFEIGELVSRKKDQTDYSFTLAAPPPKQEYGFPAKPVKDLVFSWDTLTNDEFPAPVLFHLKNTSEYIVTILKTEGNSAAVFYSDTTNQVIVLPDSSLTIEVIPNFVNKGHFYHSLIVQYQSVYGVKQFELKQWGYIPTDFGIIPADSLKLVELTRTFYRQRNEEKTGPIRLYVTNKAQLVDQNVRLELFSKESKAIIYPHKDQQGNSFFQIYRNGWDTLLIHVLSSRGEVLQKMRLTYPFEYDFYNLPFFPVPAPYTYYHGKSPYQPLNGIYQLEKQNGNFLPADTAIIRKAAAKASIRFLANGSVEIQNPAEAIALEKKLLHLPSPIRLFPVSEILSGNGIRWYTNMFTVKFYEHVSDEEIKKIFAKYKITGYSKEIYNGKNSWTFSLDYILDRKYIALLDQLWQLKEISGIIQEKLDIAGMD